MGSCAGETVAATQGEAGGWARRAAGLVRCGVDGAATGAELGAVDCTWDGTGGAAWGRSAPQEAKEPGGGRTSSPSTKPSEHFGKTALTFRGGEVRTGPSVAAEGESSPIVASQVTAHLYTVAEHKFLNTGSHCGKHSRFHFKGPRRVRSALFIAVWLRV